MAKDKKEKKAKKKQVVEQTMLQKAIEIIDSDIKGAVKIAKSYLLEEWDSPSLGRLSGGEYLAVICIAVGKKWAAKIMKELSEKEVEKLTLEIAGIYTVLLETKEKALEEFCNIYQAQSYWLDGGVDLAKDILIGAFGEERAVEIVSKLTVTLQVRPFDSLRKLSSDNLLALLKDETLKTKAIICTYLRPSQAADLFGAFSLSDKLKVTKLISEGSSIDIDIRELEEKLIKKMEPYLQETNKFGGVDAMVEILSVSTSEIEKEVLDKLKIENPQIAEDIEHRLFIFEDILCLCNTDIQLIDLLVEDVQDWVTALKGCSEEVLKVILANVAGERKVVIPYRLENSGPVYKKEVEAAQLKIVNIIKHLRDTQKIVVARGADEIIV